MVRIACVAGCLVLALAVPAEGASPNNARACRIMDPVTADCAKSWASGNRFMIRGETARDRKQIEWHYDFAANRDLKLDIRVVSDRTTETGALLLIDNSAMLTRGLPTTRDREPDALGVPVLTLQLVVDLLERAIPGGPEHLNSSRSVAIADNLTPLAIAAGNATGLIPAPWSLFGSIARGSGSRVEFDLKLSFRPMLDGASVEEMRFSGFWDKRPQAPLLPDSTKIAGWAIHRITGFSDTDSGRTISGFKTTPVPDSFATLGALRRHISGEIPDEAH